MKKLSQRQVLFCLHHLSKNRNKKALNGLIREDLKLIDKVDNECYFLFLQSYSFVGTLRDLWSNCISASATATPVSIIQHVEQLSLTFTKAAVQSSNPAEQPDEDDGMQIGFVIFDELKERKKVRDAAKRKKPARNTTTRKAATKK